MYDDFMYRIVCIIMSLFCLGITCAQEQIKELPIAFEPFEDFSYCPGGGSLSVFNQSFTSGGYVACWEAVDNSVSPLPDDPKNLALVFEDSIQMGLRAFLGGCGGEINSRAGYGSVSHTLLYFERKDKQAVYLTLYGFEESSRSSPPQQRLETVKSSVFSFERLSRGVYSFIRVSEGTKGYTEEYFFFAFSEDGISGILGGIPITYYPDQLTQDKSSQLAVRVNWPSSLEVKALTDELLPEQEKWVGTYSIPNF